MPTALQELSKLKKANGRWDWKNPNFPQSFVDLTTIMLHAGKISHQEYTFYVSTVAHHIHEDRLYKFAYSNIKHIEDRMREIELNHGLDLDHYWPNGEGPTEYERLRIEWDTASDLRFIETLEELSASDLALLYREDRKEYDRRRERGRRRIFHNDEIGASISDIVVRYETESQCAAQAGSYTAAVILLGAAVEGLLLLKCLKSKKKSQIAALSLSKGARPARPNEPLRWTLDNLIEVCLKAGWLPTVTMGSLEIRPDLLAHLLRGMRNNVHPGKVAKERPWIEIEAQDYEQARAIYTTIFTAIFQESKLKNFLQHDPFTNAN